jgi:hypothetical protein
MPTKSNLQKAIHKYEKFIEKEDKEGLQTLLCSLILIKVIMDEKKIDNPKLFKFTSYYATLMSAGANDWGNLTQKHRDDIIGIVNSIANAYNESENQHFRDFIKNIGASGFADQLGPEGRGDLTMLLIVFAELASRFEPKTYKKVSKDLSDIIVNHLECENLVEQIFENAQGFVDQIQDKYSTYS